MSASNTNTQDAAKADAAKADAAKADAAKADTKKVRLRAVHGYIIHPNTLVSFDTDREEKHELDTWTQIQIDAGKLAVVTD